MTSSQEALSAAWRKRDQYDSERGAALIVAARDRCRSGVQASPPATSDDRAGHRRGRSLGGGGLAAWLRPTAAIAQLSRRQRLAVTPHYYLGCRSPRSAEVMGCAPGTVKSTLSDARLRLRARWGMTTDDRRHSACRCRRWNSQQGSALDLDAAISSARSKGGRAAVEANAAAERAGGGLGRRRGGGCRRHFRLDGPGTSRGRRAIDRYESGCTGDACRAASGHRDAERPTSRAPSSLPRPNA